MYLTGGSTVFALEPETGTPVWKFDAGTGSKRGVAYWPGDAKTPARLYSGVSDGRMVALDAQTGAVVTDFGERGYIDLKQAFAAKSTAPSCSTHPQSSTGNRDHRRQQRRKLA